LVITDLLLTIQGFEGIFDCRWPIADIAKCRLPSADWLLYIANFLLAIAELRSRELPKG